MTNKVYPTPEKVAAAIGAGVDSSAAREFFEYLGIEWKDFTLLDKDLQLFGCESKSDGYTIQARDEGFLRELPFHDAGDGPFVITEITFWGFKKKFQKYGGELISDINFSSTFAEVKAKLGEPLSQAVVDPEMPFAWLFGHYDVSIHWPNKNKHEIIAIGYGYLPQAK